MSWSWSVLIRRRSKRWFKAAKDFGLKVMGDNLAAEDRVAAAKRLEDLGCGTSFTISGTMNAAASRRWEGHIPVRSTNCERWLGAAGAGPGGRRSFGGTGMRTPEFGARLVVLGAPLIERRF